MKYDIPHIVSQTSRPALGHIELAPSRADLVALAIEKAVLSGEFVPGERLVERDLAEALGVSKTPVREAFKMLARKGVLIAHPYRGVEVREIAPEDAVNIYQARILLEPEAVRLATPVHDSRSLAVCQAALLDAAAATGSENLADLSLANRRFHAGLYAPCPNPLLRMMLDDLQDQVGMISVASWRRRATWEGEAEEHGAILDAVRTGQCDTAARLLHRHIERFLERVARIGQSASEGGNG